MRRRACWTISRERGITCSCGTVVLSFLTEICGFEGRIGLCTVTSTEVVELDFRATVGADFPVEVDADGVDFPVEVDAGSDDVDGFGPASVFDGAISVVDSASCEITTVS